MSADDRQLAELVGLVDRERVIADLLAMVAIPSVNPFDAPALPGEAEDPLADWYADALRAAGLTVEIHDVAPGRRNVVGRLAGSGSGPSVMLAGHLDTVGVDGYADAFSPRRAGGRVHGRGACDMKAALAAFVEVARILGSAGVRPPGDLVVAAICDEEHGMIGSRALGGDTGADVAIVGEPTSLQVCPAHKGQVCVVVRTHGIAVHSSRPELGHNAIVDMARVVDALGAYSDELATRPPHPLCGLPRVNAGVIRGGTIASTVPDRCDLEIDRRTLPGETADQVLADLSAVVDRVAAGMSWELVGPTLVCDPLDTPVVEPVVAAVLAAVSAEWPGAGDLPVAFPAATDAPNLGIPAVICGPGSLEQAHTVDEYVDEDQVVAAVGVYLRAVMGISLSVPTA